MQTDRILTVLATQQGRCGRHEAYSPYGFSNNAQWCAVVGFSGQFRDSTTGCYPLGNGYRFYTASLQRFISADSLSPFGKGGLNAYAYCSGDPINNVDPSGGVTLSVFGGLKHIGVMDKTGLTQALHEAGLPNDLKIYIKGRVSQRALDAHAIYISSNGGPLKVVVHDSGSVKIIDSRLASSPASVIGSVGPHTVSVGTVSYSLALRAAVHRASSQPSVVPSAGVSWGSSSGAHQHSPSDAPPTYEELFPSSSQLAMSRAQSTQDLVVSARS
nr:RHS repeat-associated core domain-containing protein [Pseudomonas sp.]